MTDVFPEPPPDTEVETFVPTRAAGLRRLRQFLPRAGNHYARARNYDWGVARRSNVSALSPWLRHRLVTEEEVLLQVLAQHGPRGAEMFVQEVFWRTYFKGWLEQRPSVWVQYQRDLRDALATVESDIGLARNVADAVAGNTGIDCFDHWANELAATGYLHNHARMWFASIWIFTLRLPWQLGADFFLRHLLDGDPASNTLSWRWVAGLHTKGKTYLARPENIAKFTMGRFNPTGLAKCARPLVEPMEHARVPLHLPQVRPEDPFVLLLTEDDLSGASILPCQPVAVLGLTACQDRSPNPVGAVVRDFSNNAMNGVLQSYERSSRTVDDWSVPLISAAQSAGVKTIATAYTPIGPVRSRLDLAEPLLRDAGITLVRVVRPYDRVSWPHAKAGFFGLRKKIPHLINQLALTAETK